VQTLVRTGALSICLWKVEQGQFKVGQGEQVGQWDDIRGDPCMAGVLTSYSVFFLDLRPFLRGGSCSAGG
ncbi:hypothetical protein NDU88_003918, partial [Pleurodeles waltl]